MQGSPSKQAGAEAQWKVGAVRPAPFDGNKASCRTHFLNKMLSVIGIEGQASKGLRKQT